MVTKRKFKKDTFPTAEGGGQPRQAYEQPKRIEWMQTENAPLLTVLKQILEELKQINSKL